MSLSRGNAAEFAVSSRSISSGKRAFGLFNEDPISSVAGGSETVCCFPGSFIGSSSNLQPFSTRSRSRKNSPPSVSVFSVDLLILETDKATSSQSWQWYFSHQRTRGLDTQANRAGKPNKNDLKKNTRFCFHILISLDLIGSAAVCVVCWSWRMKATSVKDSCRWNRLHPIFSFVAVVSIIRGTFGAPAKKNEQQWKKISKITAS